MKRWCIPCDWLNTMMMIFDISFLSLLTQVQNYDQLFPFSFLFITRCGYVFG